MVRRESNAGASRASTSINSALCIIRLWIIRETRRTRTFRSETGQPCQPLCNFNQPMFVCPLAIESRSCLCRRCRRYCRRSTDRRAIESERRWLLIYTGKRERFAAAALFPQPGGKISFHFSRKEESRRENIRRGNNPFEYERTPFLVGRGNISGEINREEWREIHPIFVRVRRGDARRTRS